MFTNHGPDYDRQKWGGIAKIMLRLGEYLGGKFANEVIVISTVIADIIRKRCGRESKLIYNGVPLPNRSGSTTLLDQRNIIPKNYILAVARFVPEKGLHDLITAFAELKGDHQLVIGKRSQGTESAALSACSCTPVHIAGRCLASSAPCNRLPDGKWAK